MIVLGLMSGTSMDGLDCCLSKIEIENFKLRFKIIDSSTIAYKNETKKIIYDSVFNKKYSYGFIEEYLGNVYVDLIDEFLSNQKVDFISNHGQTISHLDKKYSIQVCSPKIIYNKFRVPIIYNFRNKDIENGGNGAPLMPILDWYLFKNQEVITINVGGISNITVISKDTNINSIIGFDTGPGMCLNDLYVKKTWNIKYDNQGKLASKGFVNEILLNYLMNNPFINKDNPKSASTEMFGLDYLSNLENKFTNIKRYDFLRTLVNFTSKSIIKNINRVVPSKLLEKKKIILSGGGVKNKVLFDDIKKGLNNKIILMNYEGINIDNKESFLMCLLGYTRFFNIANNIPSVTGAVNEVVCGEIYE